MSSDALLVSGITLVFVIAAALGWYGLRVRARSYDRLDTEGP